MSEDDDIDLPEDCWIEPRGGLRVGDVCAAVPFASLVGDPPAELFRHDDPPGFSVPVRLAYGLVVSLVEGYAMLAPVTTEEVIDDPENFERLAEAARTSPIMVRLPRLTTDGWWSGAVAHLFMLETLPEPRVDYSRVAAMNEEGRSVLRRRLMRAFAA
jgi:hypothetical protein